MKTKQGFISMYLLGSTVMALFFLSACGIEGGGMVGDTDSGGKGKKDKDTYSDTVTRRSCVQTYGGTKFKYIVIAYPNGDQDIYCQVNWLGKKELFLSSGHRFTLESTCQIEYGIGRTYIFNVKGTGAELKYISADIGEDPETRLPLPSYFTFQNCNEEAWDDKYWYESRYDFEENLL